MMSMFSFSLWFILLCFCSFGTLYDLSWLTLLWFLIPITATHLRRLIFLTLIAFLFLFLFLKRIRLLFLLRLDRIRQSDAVYLLYAFQKNGFTFNFIFLWTVLLDEVDELSDLFLFAFTSLWLTQIFLQSSTQFGMQLHWKTVIA